MSKLNPIPTGPEVQSHWLSDRPATVPELPVAWSASVLATPFGDSIAPQSSYSQLAVARVESATVGFESWMRVKLYLTQDLQLFDFLFISLNDPNDPMRFKSEWYWIDSSMSGGEEKIYGPFKTTLRVPGPQFLTENQAVWGNCYPLMCTDTNREGIDCDHWMIPSPGAQADHGSWYSVRRDTKYISRVFTMDSTNPMMLPFVGAYFMANFASFQPQVSEDSKELVAAAKAGRTVKEPEYWNPLVTQQDVFRAFEFPLASTKCTVKDIQNALPGFNAAPPTQTPLPTWSKKLYIEAWALAVDVIPYRMRVCYHFAGDERSRQQSIFIGWGENPGSGSYFKRTDTCLNPSGTDMPFYEWNDASGWGNPKYCLPPLPGIPPPVPDWLARDQAVLMGQIGGNPDFGLEEKQVLNIFAGKNPGDFGAMGTFWVWFLENDVGMLFCEGNFMNSLSHTLQILDYTLFERDAPIDDSDFSDPCMGMQPTSRGAIARVPGHFTHPRRKAPGPGKAKR
jgi:hypothetical protein